MTDVYIKPPSMKQIEAKICHTMAQLLLATKDLPEIRKAMGITRTNTTQQPKDKQNEKEQQ